MKIKSETKNICKVYELTIETDRGLSVYSVSLNTGIPDDDLIQREEGVELNESEFEELQDYCYQELR